MNRPPSTPSPLTGRSGLTLIELTAATVLLAVLLAALAGLVPAFTERSAAMAEAEASLDAGWQRAAAELIAQDLVNARAVRGDQATLEIAGFVARNPETGAATGREGVVTYRIVRAGDRPALLRSDGETTGLAAWGRFRIEVETLGRSGEEPAAGLVLDPGLAPAEEPTELTLRERVRIRVSAAGRRAPAERTVRLVPDLERAR